MNTLSLSDATRVPASAWILLGAVTATALDLAFAAIYWELNGGSSLHVMQAIAAYWGWGREAYAGGVATAAIGMALFLGRMVLLAALYFAAARRFPALARRPYLSGALFGLAVYLVNQYVVLPSIGSMPAYGPSRDWVWGGACIAAHMGLIGVPLALCARIAIAAQAMAQPRAAAR